MLGQCESSLTRWYRDLEKAVEDLSQMLEEDIDPSSVKSLRQRMVDKTVRSSGVAAVGRVSDSA